MKTVRERILDYIRSHRALTVAELSLAFQMTPANARYHLAILLELGLLQVVAARPVSGKGRPAHIFAISEQALGDNLDLLAGILLDRLASQTEAEQLESALKQLATQLASRMAAGGKQSETTAKAGENLTRRLYRTTEILNQQHYQARWEARPEAPRLVLGHCPFVAILKEHPELCKIDAYLIEQLTGSPVKQTAKLAKDPSGLRFCQFRIGKERV
jgi:predicted ArsR family transcriptional regulator